MNRRKFLFSLGALGMTGIGLSVLNQIKTESKQPILFLGHGSPMNALADNEFSRSWKSIGKSLNPSAILVVSAHWETFGSKVFAGTTNKTIHDFYGFPQELFQMQYPAPANPDLAQQLSQKITTVETSHDWGLDHGAWSVLVHAFPQANIPVIQLSLNKNLTIADHFKLAQELNFLRNHGVLIIGSGNIVHNLRKIQWNNPLPFDWAQDFQNKVIQNFQNQDYAKTLELIKDNNFNLAHPSVEHFLPLIYIAALADSQDKVEIFTPKIDLASISMASFLLK